MARPQPQSSSLNPSARSGSQLGQAHNQQQQAQARNPRQEGNTSPNQSRASTFFSSFRKNSTEDKGENIQKISCLVLFVRVKR